MSGLDQLRLEVLGDEIIVILPATSYGVTYYKPPNTPHLLVKNFLLKLDSGAPMTQGEFLVRAWRAANEKAQRAGVDRKSRKMTIVCLGPTNPPLQVRPAQSGERGSLGCLQFASMISFQVFQAFDRFLEFARNDRRRKHRFQWQAIGGEYPQRHVPATSKLLLLPGSDLRPSRPPPRAQLQRCR
jgi:hypothetical protein